MGACCSPPVEEVGHRPDRIPRCERAAAGIHVGSEHPPDLGAGRTCVWSITGARSPSTTFTGAAAPRTERLTTDRRIDRRSTALRRSQPPSSANVAPGFASTRQLGGADVTGHPAPPLR